MSKYHLQFIRDLIIGVILMVFFMLVLSKAVGCQNYGFNGTNVPENLTPEVRQWVIDMHPVGDTVVMVFRNDKYEGATPEQDINNVIILGNELRAQGREFSIIYTINTRGVYDNLDALYAFMSFDMVMAIRLGNEEYFKAAGHGGNWSTYWAIAEPIKTRVEGFGYPILIPIADHLDTKWNPLAAAVINSDPLLHPDYHFYWGRNELDIYGTLVNDALPKVSNAVGHSDFYENFYNEITTSDNLSETMAWFYNTFPSKDMYITEWGAGGNVGGIGGTVGFEAANDWFLNEISGYSNVRAVCKFNGASITGYITPTGKLDISTEPYIKRLGYFTLFNFYQSRYSLTLGLKESVHNLTLDTLYFDRKGYTATFTGIVGSWDASSGACAWWASNSVKTYEISGLITSAYVPPMSYGYVLYEPNKGCTDINATNFNPDAIQDDGSCVYPVKCLRKRWLFSSLPCKEAKSRCNCE